MTVRYVMSTGTERKVSICFRLPAKHSRELLAMGLDEGVSRGDLIRRAIAQYLEKREEVNNGVQTPQSNQHGLP